MSSIYELLSQRNSAPRLTEPAPDEQTREAMYRAAVRAPDHAWLQPWRFIEIEGAARDALGRVFRTSLLASQPDADEAACTKAANAPLRAPLLVTVVCRVQEHPKVPREEQLISTGCAAHAMLLAAEAGGFAGIWRTGSYALDPIVTEALGLSDDEEIVGFLYFGSRDGAPKKLPEREIDKYVSRWDP